MKFIDMHCDTIAQIGELRKQGKSCFLNSNELQLDIMRMKEAGYLMQTFALFIDKENTKYPLEDCMSLLDIFYMEMEKNSEWIRPITSADQLLNNKREGIMSALLAIEEGGVCFGRMELLRDFYRLGVRLITLTWNYENEIGFPNKVLENEPFGKSETEHGIKEMGIYFLEEMERLGMIIDVSHLGDAGFYDVCRYTKKPFLASHSNSRTICPHVRNMTDDMIRMLAERGGVIGINFAASFTEYQEGKGEVGTIDGLIRHMKYIVNLAGIESVGLGTDFDGIERNIEMDDCSMMPILAERMKKAGFSEEEVEKICYKNMLRFIQEVL
ncbi:Membrane dipeptidase (Peptidase family M19) [Clostridiales bacterium CHKCI001]|nr:Membrane dipeptidase (Peptidase family M19) [Clostridiales bacterium CHKCI001]